jgi:hypothetical protein
VKVRREAALGRASDLTFHWIQIFAAEHAAQYRVRMNAGESNGLVRFK